MPDDDFPFVLNTGWLIGRVAKLNKLNPRPFIEVHPDDAAALRFVDGAQVEIASRRGAQCYRKPSPIGSGKERVSHLDSRRGRSRG